MQPAHIIHEEEAKGSRTPKKRQIGEVGFPNPLLEVTFKSGGEPV